MAFFVILAAISGLTILFHIALGIDVWFAMAFAIVLCWLAVKVIDRIGCWLEYRRW